MERKVGFNSGVLSWMLFLLASFAKLSHGGVDKDLPNNIYAKEAIIETFKVDGHVINCIDINKQPAFEHPLLINHTVQLKPIYYPEKMRVDDHLGEASHPWNLSKSCPEGSIPIQAVHKNGHLRDNPFVNHWYKDSLYSLWQIGTENRKHGLKGREDEEAVQHSSIAVRGGKYYGSKTSMNVWNPKVGNKYEYSISQIWVSSADERTSLEAGWAVFPDLYGEDKTRFFIRWTTDHYKTGCYNLRCPGFIQTNRRTILDSYLQPISVYGGPQYFIDVEIFKDRATGNWWLRLQGVEIGYWPMELVLSLAGGARFLSFGGVVTTSRSALQTSTEMGSGHLSNEGFKKSSFFKNVQVLDASYTYRNPDPGLIRTLMECPACYDLQVGQTKDGPWGFFFSYGGPGRSGKRT